MAKTPNTTNERRARERPSPRRRHGPRPKSRNAKIARKLTRNKQLAQGNQKKQARSKAKLLIKQCDKLGIPVPEAQRICAEKRYAPCGLASCLLCRSRFRDPAIRLAVKHFAGAGFVQWVTVTPASGLVLLEEAANFDLHGFIAGIQRKFRVGLPPGRVIIGAVDVSANLHENGPVTLQFHIHALIAPGLSDAQKRTLSAAFTRDRVVIKRPVRVEYVKSGDLQRFAGYTFKWFHQRRSSFDPFIGDGDEVIRPKPEKQSLKRPENVAIHNALQRYPVSDLLFLMGVKRKRSSNPLRVELMGAK